MTEEKTEFWIEYRYKLFSMMDAFYLVAVYLCVILIGSVESKGIVYVTRSHESGLAPSGICDPLSWNCPQSRHFYIQPQSSERLKFKLQ